MSTPDRTRRDVPQFHSILAFDDEPLDGCPVVAGLHGVPVSADDATGAATYLARLPAGWSHDEAADLGCVELFVLEGDLACEGERVGVGGYVCLPQGCGGAQLSSERGARALVYWNPDMPQFPPPFARRRVTTLWAEPWQEVMPGAHGVLQKCLRQPDLRAEVDGQQFDGGPGGYLRVYMLAPGLAIPDQHVHHECWEEVVLLKGDALIGGQGVMAPGSYQGNPQEWWHTPFGSQGGGLLLAHTDAPMGFPWPPRPYPDGAAILDDYIGTTPMLAHPTHRDWDDDPDLRRWSETEAYAAWRSSPEGAEWVHGAWRGGASAFRAARRAPR